MLVLRLVVDVPYAKKKLLAATVLPARAGPVNACIKATKMPREFSRRSRPLQDGLKSEEFRNICLFLFPSVLDAVTDSKSKKVFAYMAYVGRLYYNSQEEFENHDSERRRVVRVRFLELIQEAFGRDIMGYNFHLLTHLEMLRAHGPLPETSAIPFEGSYSPLRKAFAPGTAGIPAQIMRGLLLRLCKGHSCVKGLRVAPQSDSTRKRDDSLLYRYHATSSSYSFYRVVRVEANGDHVAHHVITDKTTFGVPQHPDHTLTWDKVGAYRFVSLSPLEPIAAPLSSFTGKAILVQVRSGKYILSIPSAVLREQ